jgi:hypothetical protein
MLNHHGIPKFLTFIINLEHHTHTIAKIRKERRKKDIQKKRKERNIKQSIRYKKRNKLNLLYKKSKDSLTVLYYFYTQFCSLIASIIGFKVDDMKQCRNIHRILVSFCNHGLLWR